MKNKTSTKEFQYLQFVFTPVRKFTRNENKNAVGIMMRQFCSIGIAKWPVDCGYLTNKWNHIDFYKAAEMNHMATDIYLIDGKCLVVPCENELFALNKDEALKFKCLHQYDQRYQLLYSRITYNIGNIQAKLKLHQDNHKHSEDKYAGIVNMELIYNLTLEINKLL